jgi:hypothetical protein
VLRTLARPLFQHWRKPILQWGEFSVRTSVLTGQEKVMQWEPYPREGQVIKVMSRMTGACI